MPTRSVLAALAVSLILPAMAYAQDARSILETAQQKQLDRWEGIDAYVVVQSTMGQQAATWFVRTDVEQPDGSTKTVFLPMNEIQMRNDPCGLGKMTDEDLATLSMATDMAGNAMAEQIEGGLAAAGLPPGLLAATGSDPWNTMDPRVMMGGYSDFLTAAVHAQREMDAYDPNKDAQAKLDELSAFLDNATLVGTETVEGRPAWHLRATGINQVQKQDGQEYHMDSISLFVDQEMYVPLVMRVDGRMIADGVSQPMAIENISTDYRQVPGSNLYESYRQVMRMSGIMTPEQEIEMRDAQAQIVEFEQQMATMPADQRRMMESMMGPQIEMMRNMAKGNGFETEVIVKDIQVNPETNDESSLACPEDEPDSVQVVAAADEVPVRSAADLKTAQQACLQEKIEEAQAAQKKKRGFGKLLSGVARLAGQTGNIDLAQKTGDIYQAGATAGDFAQAAKDLGLTEDDVAACQDPV